MTLHYASNPQAPRPVSRAAPITCEWISPDLRCEFCEDGELWTSRYGGNDPDVWKTGDCEDCDGEGNVVCSAKWCGETATIADDDRVPYCEKHAPSFDELFNLGDWA